MLEYELEFLLSNNPSYGFEHIPDRDREYLEVPYREKEEAKKLGAKWAKEKKKWYRKKDGRGGGSLKRELDKYKIVYLDIPFSEKERAKELGARWCPNKKSWYTFTENMTNFPSDDHGGILAGEDRDFGGNTLFVDLIPKSCWFTNVRYCIDRADWDTLRRRVYKRVKNICECCGKRVRKGESLEAHERWSYKDGIQKLERVVALCTICHQVTHYGHSKGLVGEEVLRTHLKHVRGFGDVECEEHIQEAYRLVAERNLTDWELDLSMVTDNGFKLARTVRKEDRRSISAARSESRPPRSESRPPRSESRPPSPRAAARNK
ncbi:MAG: hypothetical protein KDD60_12055, partial [Bdellovibrionales bacterium]|nr:hypothetical protein [Bdellovibrionales bacterium]